MQEGSRIVIEGLIADITDWLDIRLIYLMVITLLLKDCHGDEIKGRNVNDCLSNRQLSLG